LPLLGQQPSVAY